MPRYRTDLLVTCLVEAITVGARRDSGPGPGCPALPTKDAGGPAGQAHHSTRRAADRMPT